jgi:ribonuclease BN (tRNA processing enzyme)
MDDVEVHTGLHAGVRTTVEAVELGARRAPCDCTTRDIFSARQSSKLLFEEDEGEKRLVFSGDLGKEDSVLMRPPQRRLKAADVVLMESTYGDREHKRR